MALFKRGRTHWYEFVFDGERVRRSTKTRNKEAAKQIEAAERTLRALVKAGLAEPEIGEPEQAESEPPTVPSLCDFALAFREHIELRSARSLKQSDSIKASSTDCLNTDLCRAQNSILSMTN